MSQLVNLTPHPINFFRAGDVYRRGNKLLLFDAQTQPYMVLDTPVPPRPVRLQSTLSPCGFIDGVPTFSNTIEAIANLPSYCEADDIIYVVSRPAAEVLWALGRRDIACPVDTIYVTDTRVVGCTGLRLADINPNQSERR